MPTLLVRTQHHRTPALTDDRRRPTRSRPAADTVDALLVRVGADRDRAAFRSLVELTGPRLKGRLRRGVSDAARAEDLLQDTFLRVWKSAPRFDPGRGSGWTWLHTIARRVLVDHLRRDGRPEPDWTDPGLQPLAPERPDALTQRARLGRTVRAALAELPDEQRAVLEAAWFEQRSLAAYAEAEGLPSGTVKSRVRLGMDKLRHALAALGDT